MPKNHEPRRTESTPVGRTSGRVPRHFALEVEMCLANSDGEPIGNTGHVIAIMFNADVISEGEVNALLDRGADLERDPRVIVTTPDRLAAFKDGVMPDGIPASHLRKGD